MTDNTLDNLKQKASEVGEDLKFKAKEAQLQGEKAVDDLKHSASEAKLAGEEKLTDLKRDAQDSSADNKAVLDDKLSAVKD